MPVVGGSTANSPPGLRGTISSTAFLREVLAAGAGATMDAVSVHAYPGARGLDLRAALTPVFGARRALRSVGLGDLPIWVTETGITTSGPAPASNASQARDLVELQDMLAGGPGVRMVLIHTLVDPPGPPASPESGYGVVRADGAPKAGYCRLAVAWGGSGCRQVRDGGV